MGHMKLEFILLMFHTSLNQSESQSFPFLHSTNLLRFDGLFLTWAATSTALDREARRRGTTVYLVQRASPMLPPTLCESLCSLQPGEERLSFSAVFKMSEEGRVLSTWFGKSVIK